MKVECDILIVGGSTGGIAAALAAAESGASVCLLEETEWLGGQLTTQGVSTPDEHPLIEQFGATRRYYAFRNAVRDYYKTNFKLSARAAAEQYFNPGNCWVAHYSFEPKVGAQILSQFVLPSIDAGRLKIFFKTTVLACDVDSHHRVKRVICRSDDSPEMEVHPKYVLDATDLGEVLALAGSEGEDWVTGAESRQQTGEPDAPDEARPDWVQPFTFPFALEWSPDSKKSNVIPAPEDYEELKALQNFHIKHGAITGLFEGAFPWWTYRRLLAAENFVDQRVKNDLAIVNTAGNDFYGGNIIGSAAGDAVKMKDTLEQARRASLAYLHWLQTECPREDDPSGHSFGYPEFRLRTDVFETKDGASIKPYIRESRRIKSLRTILEHEIVVADFKGNPCRGEKARAVSMPDSVGVGHYALDIHPNGHGEPNAYVATRPFQIPLGALLPVRLKNLLPACKNLGTTHLTNGAYRLHPIEWNIGESAGILAAFCIRHHRLPSEVYYKQSMVAELQKQLLNNGIPLYWFSDVSLDHKAFEAVQMLACAGVPLGNDADLLFRPDEMISEDEWRDWNNAARTGTKKAFSGTRADAAIGLYRDFHG